MDQDTLLDQGATETKPHPPFHSYAKQATNRSQMPDSLLNNSTRLHKSSINEGRISAFKPLGPTHMPLLLAIETSLSFCHQQTFRLNGCTWSCNGLCTAYPSNQLRSRFSRNPKHLTKFLSSPCPRKLC